MYCTQCGTLAVSNICAGCGAKRMSSFDAWLAKRPALGALWHLGVLVYLLSGPVLIAAAVMGRIPFAPGWRGEAFAGLLCAAGWAVSRGPS